jgi:excisionase family DNA binding protein
MQHETEALSILDAAKTLRISKRQVHRLLEEGSLPSFRIGRRRLIRATTLAKFVALLEANSARKAA